VAHLNDTWQTGLSNGKRDLIPVHTIQEKTKSHEPTACTQHNDGAIPEPDCSSADGSLKRRHHGEIEDLHAQRDEGCRGCEGQIAEKLGAIQGSEVRDFVKHTRPLEYRA
jgi:hypothetical protein